MTAFSIQVEDAGLEAALAQLQARSLDMTPAMRAISYALLSQTEANFAAQSGPSGQWTPIAAASRGKRGKSGRILQDTGRLAASVTPFHSRNEAGIGSNVIYAAIHQLGGRTKPHVILPRNKKALAFGGRVVKKVNHPGSLIPARPYMPVTRDGRLQAGLGEQIADMLAGYLTVGKAQ